ncbi:MAG: ABC transporter substrate-binding protein [bacterium]|nr:ABC transporter substrate-binding protein [bacterium]
MSTRRTDPTPATPSLGQLFVVLLTASSLFLLIACGETGAPESTEESDGALRIGLLLDYEGGLGHLGVPAEEGALFAVEMINAAGGVGGRDVELVIADGATDPAVSVDEARRLVDEENVSAIFGPLSSAAALVVAGEVTIEAKVPIISPSATTPLLTSFVDDGYVFRSCLSDSVQGPVLAWIAEDEDLSRVAILYRNDPYGIKLWEEFAQAYGGEITSAVAIEPDRPSYLGELREAAAGSPEALVTIAFAKEGEIFLVEALDNELFSRFIFSDAMSHPFLIEAVGGDRLEGVRGTLTRGSGGVSEQNIQEWTSAFTARFGQPPALLSQAAFDVVLSVCLSAEKAGSTSRRAIRDTLATITGGGGELTPAINAAGVNHALTKVRAGEEVDYQGISCGMDFTPGGDLAAGSIQVFEIQSGLITIIHELPVDIADGFPSHLPGTQGQ